VVESADDDLIFVVEQHYCSLQTTLVVGSPYEMDIVDHLEILRVQIIILSLFFVTETIEGGGVLLDIVVDHGDATIRVNYLWVSAVFLLLL
jgi:hypothetical protein